MFSQFCWGNVFTILFGLLFQDAQGQAAERKAPGRTGQEVPSHPHPRPTAAFAAIFTYFYTDREYALPHPRSATVTSASWQLLSEI